MEALPTWLEVRGEDRRCGHQLLPDSEETASQTGADFLAEFDYVLEYKPGKINLVTDALNRKSEFAAILSHPQSSLLDRI